MSDRPKPETAPLMHAAANDSIEAMFRMGCDIERQLAEARKQREQLANAIRAFMTEFENGNCMVESLADTLFDSLKVLQGGGK